MINGLESYKLLFMVQLMVGEGIFLLRLERKRNFFLRVSVCSVGLLSAAALIPILMENAWYVSFLFLTLFVLSLFALRFCFDEPLGKCCKNTRAQLKAYRISSFFPMKR